MNEALFFYSFAGLTLLAALYVVLTKNPTYAVLSLVAAMFSLAILFVLLHAYFIAVVHVLVYAGAILVLFLFVVMLLGVGKEEQAGPDLTKRRVARQSQRLYRIFGGLVVTGFLLEIGIIIKAVSSSAQSPAALSGTIEEVGKLLFTEYFLPFEITSVLLLVGIIGAVVLSKKEEPGRSKQMQAEGQPRSGQAAGGRLSESGQAEGL